MDKTKVAIVGMGTVGAGVAKLLLDFGDRTARHAGRTLWVESVVVRDLNKNRSVDLPEGILTDDLNVVLNNPEIKVVAQLIGGLHPAKEIMLQLLEAGKDVVTANKALLANYGPELFDAARKLGRTIAFEASVAGGIPIITNISQCLAANQIESLQAILNGTSNYIVTDMQENGVDFQQSVAQAQELGFAEADPTMDVDGTDAAQKLAILSHLAFGARVDWKEIPRRGIEEIGKADFQYASRLGFSLKLLASAQLRPSEDPESERPELEVHVSPTLIRRGTPMAEVRRNFNAVRVVGDAVGPTFFHGQGAGQMPTASAVVADLIDVAVGRAALTFGNLKLWSKQPPRVALSDYDRSVSKNYFRFDVVDRPSVLTKIAGILGDHNISINAVHQYDGDKNPENDSVPLVIVTHAASEKNARGAYEQIKKLDVLVTPGQRLRILD